MVITFKVSFSDHRHVTFGYNRYVAAGPPYQVVKTAGMNLPSYHYVHVCAKPDWCDATVELQLLAGCLTTGKWIKGGSPHILVDTFASGGWIFSAEPLSSAHLGWAG